MWLLPDEDDVIQEVHGLSLQETCLFRSEPSEDECGQHGLAEWHHRLGCLLSVVEGVAGREPNLRADVLSVHPLSSQLNDAITHCLGLRRGATELRSRLNHDLCLLRRQRRPPGCGGGEPSPLVI